MQFGRLTAGNNFVVQCKAREKEREREIRPNNVPKSTGRRIMVPASVERWLRRESKMWRCEACSGTQAVQRSQLV